MIDSTIAALALEWLLPEPGAPWNWDEAGEVIVWHDGTTLLFRDELVQIIERLPERLPAAGLIFTVLAASRGKLPPAPVSQPLIDEALDRLRALAKLPPALLTGIAARASLAEALTEGLPRTSADQAAAALQFLRHGPRQLRLDRTPDPAKAKQVATRYLHQLRARLSEMNVAALELRLAAGIDAIPNTAPLKPVAERVASLLLEIDPSEDELTGIARLARDIMAAISLPHALATPEVHSLGGLSDIANRGPLHRLLISELAHDDDTLSLRLALNEALYVRTEPPASTPDSDHLLVVDSGIRLWGSPRIFATAAALALLARTPKGQTPAVYRAKHDGAAPIDLTTRAGLVEHLGALELGEHPGAALREVLAAAEDSPRTVDATVITHERALEDPDFQEVAAQPFRGNLHLVTVDRSGGLKLRLATRHGWRLLKEAYLDLAQLLPAPAARRLTASDPNSPALYRQVPFPFLLPPRAMQTFPAKGWAIGMMASGALCFWRQLKPPVGARRVPGPIMRGITLFCRCEGDQVLWLTWEQSDRSLCLLRWTPPDNHHEPVPEMQVTRVEDSPRPEAVFVRNGMLYVVYPAEVDLFTLANGNRFTRARRPPMGPPAGPGFFYLNPSQREVVRLVWNGATLETPVVAQSDPSVTGGLVHVFTPAPDPGQPEGTVWMLDYAGKLMDATTRRKITSVDLHPRAHVEVSPDRSRLWFTRKKDGKAVSLILESGLVAENFSPLEQWRTSWGPGRQAPPTQWTIRKSFTHAAVQPGGRLLLRSQKGRWVGLQVTPPQRAFEFKSIDMIEPTATSIPFAPLTLAAPDADWTMMVANFPGARIFLDSRGLLSLQSKNLHVPEVSFVLAESSSLPVWTSDGAWIGPAYFMADQTTPPSDPRPIDELIVRILTEGA